MRKNILSSAVFSAILGLFQTILTLSPAAAYQINLDYSDVKTLDTVTPKGIYYQVIVYLNAAPEVLDKIQRVRYELDDNFYQSEVEVRSPERKFALEVQSLEHFNVIANIYFIDGKNLTLNKYIMLNIHPPKLSSVHKVSFVHTVSKEKNKNGKKSYDIRLLIKGSGDELSQIDHVEYWFPPNSPQRPAKVDAGPDFHYDLEMGEEASLQAYIYFKDGTITELVRFVYFKYY